MLMGTVANNDDYLNAFQTLQLINYQFFLFNAAVNCRFHYFLSGNEYSFRENRKPYKKALNPIGICKTLQEK